MLTKTDTTGECADCDLTLLVSTATNLRKPPPPPGGSAKSVPGGPVRAPNDECRGPNLSARSDRCLCSACGEFFNSAFAFEFHRTGDWTRRRCRDRQEMRSLGMRLNNDQCWVSAGRRVSTPWCSTSSRDRDRPLPNHRGPGGASALGQEVRP
jgi:hypothetical protein